MGIVLLCPGQGQVPRDLGDLVLASGDDLAAAYADKLGADAHLDPLKDFARAQAALVAVGIGRGRRALELLQTPSVRGEYGEVLAIAGHSLGEITALALGGALDATDAVRLAADRGRAFEDFHSPDWDAAGMLAISGPTVQDEIAALLAEYGGELANDNAPDQVVVSATHEQIAALTTEARERSLRAVRLETTGPGHSSYMASIVAPVRAAVEGAPFHAATIPVYSGLTAAPFIDLPGEVSGILANQVRWRETLLELATLEPTHFLDVGPGGAMARLARKTVPDVPTVTLDDLESA
ncbi:MAG: ACP S-malonyltransferase [Solirubrobacteraceae bacterium]|nr:ACP S-malonyltransferase [Patulibacter sp.]